MPVFRSLKTFIYLSVFSSVLAFAQTKSGTTFVSGIDQSLTMHKVVILPFKDNVSNIYAKPLTDKALETHKRLHLWDVAVVEGNIDSTNPKAVQAFLKSQNAEGLLTGNILKGPESIQIVLSMLSAMDGKVLYQARRNDIRGFNTDDVVREFESLHQELVNQIPYRGLVLSRRGQEVTFNLGSENGLRQSQSVTVFQIVKVNRHPKLGFMVGSEKVILGKVKIFKADEYLSFGEIEFEKEAGSIQVNQKLFPDTFVYYPSGKHGGAIAKMDDGGVLGNNPAEWTSENKPHIGAVQLRAGILQYTQSVAMSTSGTKTIATNAAPVLDVGGELWFSQLWFLDAQVRQSIFSTNNSLAGSSPGTIDMSVGYYSIAMGYNMILGESYFGPKFQGLLGVSQFVASASETTPLLTSTMSYGGAYIGLRGYMNLDEQVPWLFGAQFKYHLSRTLTEGKSSGSSGAPTMTEFDFIVKRSATPRMNYVGNLSFSFYDSAFTGQGDRSEPVSSITHKNTMLTVGIEYLF